MSFQEFFEMGGYGLYVWSTYAIAVVIFIGLYVSVKLQYVRLTKQLRRKYQLQDRQKSNKKTQ